MTRLKRQLRAVVIPAIIVVLGVVAARVLIVLSPSAQRKTVEPPVFTVEVARLRTVDTTAQVEATGLVVPAQEISLVPEVAGRIVYMSSQLVPGGRFKAGDLLARIDPRDYELALRQEESRVRQAELELQLELGRQGIAAREWKLLTGGKPGGGKSSQAGSDLALRKPHLLAAQVQLEAAQSGLRRARINLERTQLRAPFNGVVVSESVDVGQVVAPGAALARLVGTDHVWVRASLPVEQLALIQRDRTAPPGATVTPAEPIANTTPVAGAPARVTQQLTATTAVVRDGTVLQLVGELDPQTRRAQLVIQVAGDAATATSEGASSPSASASATAPAPSSAASATAVAEATAQETQLALQTGAPASARLPLLPGAYVSVQIAGRKLRDVVRVPRSAIQDGDVAWVVDDQSRLQSRTIQVGWSTTDALYVTAGLNAGERLVLSPMASPVAGSKVVPQETATVSRADPNTRHHDDDSPPAAAPELAPSPAPAAPAALAAPTAPTPQNDEE